MSKQNKDKKIKLEKVVIVKHETCRTYALKRIGLGSMLSIGSDTPTIESIAFGGDFEQLTKPVKGCLLLWTEKGQFAHNAGAFIDEAGRVVLQEKKIYGHLGVYEGEGLYSDVVSGRYFPELNLGKLDDIAPPDYILNYIIKNK